MIYHFSMFFSCEQRRESDVIDFDHCLIFQIQNIYYIHVFVVLTLILDDYLLFVPSIRSICRGFLLVPSTNWEFKIDYDDHVPCTPFLVPTYRKFCDSTCIEVTLWFYNEIKFVMKTSSNLSIEDLRRRRRSGTIGKPESTLSWSSSVFSSRLNMNRYQSF